jgi:hypothetical protein
MACSLHAQTQKADVLLRKLEDVFRRYQSQPVDRVVKVINPVVPDWVNCFAVGQRAGWRRLRTQEQTGPRVSGQGAAFIVLVQTEWRPVFMTFIGAATGLTNQQHSICASQRTVWRRI